MSDTAFPALAVPVNFRLGLEDPVEIGTIECGEDENQLANALGDMFITAGRRLKELAAAGWL